MQLRVICDSVLYAYLSRIADTAEKRHYIDLACTIFGVLDFESHRMLLDNLHKLKVFDLHLSDFPPCDLRVFLNATSWRVGFSDYFSSFRWDPERSREFYYEDGLWNAFVATRYMRYFRTLSNSR